QLDVFQVIPGCHGPHEVTYDQRSNLDPEGIVELFIWNQAEWDADMTTPIPGLESWTATQLLEHECANSTRIDVPGGYAIATATWRGNTLLDWINAGTTGCPAEPYDYFLARVFRDGLVVTVFQDSPDNWDGDTPFESVDNLLTIVNALQYADVE
ncbi:MAG TPA: hypothetical protein VFV93_04580, partial [Thermomicrobiales bacterium]|nr:hypothetical protein [Thermomicrobiales bacterium]